MGLIKAAAGAIGGVLADSWLDFIEADEMGPTTAMVRGVQVNNKRSSNTKSTADYVSNGSRIVVGQNQMMILVDGGRIADYCAEPGYYEVFFSSAPSLFNGEFKDTLKDGVKDDDFDVGAELEKPTFSKAGDIWTLGRHRLI